MANAFLSELTANVGTSNSTVYTCPAATQTTIIGLVVTNRKAQNIGINVSLDGSGRTSGAEPAVFLLKDAPIPEGSSLVIVGGDQKVIMEPGDAVKVYANTTLAADVVLSHLDIT